MTRVGPAALAGGSALLLLAWMGLWMAVGPDGPVPAPVAVLIAWLPILPVIPALFRGRRKAAGWCSLVGVFYAGFAVMELAANPPARPWATVALGLACLMIYGQLGLARSRPPRADPPPG